MPYRLRFDGLNIPDSDDLLEIEIDAFIFIKQTYGISQAYELFHDYYTFTDLHKPCKPKHIWKTIEDEIIGNLRRSYKGVLPRSDIHIGAFWIEQPTRDIPAQKKPESLMELVESIATELRDLVKREEANVNT